jgi:hypothetical protein
MDSLLLPLHSEQHTWHLGASWGILGLLGILGLQRLHAEQHTWHLGQVVSCC